MFKVPWAEPIEAALRPYELVVTLLVISIAFISLWIAWKGTATGKTAWLVWMMIP